jgi:hypothetical protein
MVLMLREIGKGAINKKQNPPLARLVDEPLAGSGKVWRINPAALEIEPR